VLVVMLGDKIKKVNQPHRFLKPSSRDRPNDVGPFPYTVDHF
jgi:hypothetical protein